MAGRPTDYRPEYCEQIIAYMALGFSKTAFAGSIGTSRQTLLDWAKANPAFFDAVKKAEAARVMKLEDDFLNASEGPRVTSRIFALKNADPEEWRDKIETRNEHSGPDGKPMETVTRIELVAPALNVNAKD